jgi:Cu(I)/Ag(I) efflux system membrane protein CusA/SilA
MLPSICIDFSYKLRTAQAATVTSTSTGGISSGIAATAQGPVYVPLGEVAQFRIVDGPAMISSEDGLPVIVIQMNSRDRDVVSFANEANQVIKEKVTLYPPPDIHISGRVSTKIKSWQRLGLPLLYLLWCF